MTLGINLPNTTGQDETDESLMRRFKAGDGESFEALFERYSARLINFAFRFLRSRQESEDVAQEVLLRVHGARERYDPSRPFRPWLFSIAARLVSNRLRQKKRHPLFSIFSRDDEDGETIPLLDPPDRRSDRPEDTVEKDYLAAVVQASLAKLPKNQRMAVALARYEEMPHDEIARTMGVSVPAVKSLLFRARQTLKIHLARFVSSNPK